MTFHSFSHAAKLKVLFAATEAAPLIKVGGLGDVAGSLPHALQGLILDNQKEIDIRLVLPFHRLLHNKYPDTPEIARFTVPHRGGPIAASVHQITVEGLIYYLIDGEPIRTALEVYGADREEDARKYIFFSQALLEMGKHIQWIPDILHANDWHTAASIYAMRTSRRFTADYFHTRSVLTIHNLPFMGADAEKALVDFNLTKCSDTRLPEWGCKQPLPLGILTADHIVAVSPTYAEEILTPEFGCGLEDILAARQAHLSGILNGIDTETWDPVTDLALPTQYSWDSLELRQINKQSLLHEFNLPAAADVPIIAIISRLFHQKGIDLAVEALRLIVDHPWQAIILGTGDPQLEQACRQLEADFPDRVRTALTFDLKLSQRIYGGADMLLMPSRYEPCGLSQMIAMRYGCLPIARATGGLKDSIQDSKSKPEQNTGFLFQKATAKACATAVKRALQTWQNPLLWKKMQINSMTQDFSWSRSANQYAAIYQKLQEEIV